jgi:hypothetical protein
MKGEVDVTGPEIALVLGTRAALGIGFGMLLARRFSDEARRSIGWTLLLAGGFSAAVQASALFGRPRPLHMKFGSGRNGNGSSHDSLDLLKRESTRVGD